MQTQHTCWLRGGQMESDYYICIQQLRPFRAGKWCPLLRRQQKHRESNSECGQTAQPKQKNKQTHLYFYYYTLRERKVGRGINKDATIRIDWATGLSFYWCYKNSCFHWLQVFLGFFCLAFYFCHLFHYRPCVLQGLIHRAIFTWNSGVNTGVARK